MSSMSSNIVMEPERDQQEPIMENFRRLLKEEASQITLTNVYKEILITHPASISKISRNRLELCTSEMQLAAIGQCKEVHIRSPHLSSPIVGQLVSIDIKRSAVMLANLKMADNLDEDRRTTLRVRFKRPLNITLYADGNKISGVIHDISLGGCCINTPVCTHLKGASDICVELKLIDHTTDQIRCMKISCSLVRVAGSAALSKCALTFQHTPQTEQFLATFIFQRQRDILKELLETI
jgi:hypothetical protein